LDDSPVRAIDAALENSGLDYRSAGAAGDDYYRKKWRRVEEA